MYENGLNNSGRFNNEDSAVPLCPPCLVCENGLNFLGRFNIGDLTSFA